MLATDAAVGFSVGDRLSKQRATAFLGSLPRLLGPAAPTSLCPSTAYLPALRSHEMARVYRCAALLPSLAQMHVLSAKECDLGSRASLPRTWGASPVSAMLTPGSLGQCLCE